MPNYLMQAFLFNINALGKYQVLKKTNIWCSEIKNQHTLILHSALITTESKTTATKKYNHKNKHYK